MTTSQAALPIAPAADMPQRSASKICNIEAGRAIAAMLVVAYHADKYYFSNPKYWTQPLFDGLFKFGHAGVEFFFVLSGYIIAMIHARDVGQPGRFSLFVRKRFVRLYPFYWLCLILAVALYFAVPSFGPDKVRDPGNILGSFFLAGINPKSDPIFVAWTLFHEILFYAMFAIGILNRRAGQVLFVLWMLACCASPLFTPDPAYPLAFINILFAIGLASCALQNRISAAHCATLAPLLATGGLVMFLATGLDDSFWHVLPREAQILGFGIGAAMLLLGLVDLENRGRFRARGVLLLLGQASYSLYLTHMLVLSFAAKALSMLHLPRHLPPVAGFVVLCLAAATGGVIIHLLVERPLLAAIGRKLLPRRVPRLADPA